MFDKKDGQYRLIAYFGNEDTVTLPGNIDGNTYSIYRMRGVRNVVIPSGVTSMGDYAFEFCKSLTSIEIPSSVTSIGWYAFYYCTSLESIEIPSSVTSIGSYAFYNCTGLTSIEIPSSVTSIGERAFSGCGNLSAVYYTGTDKQWSSISIGANNEPIQNATIVYKYVPIVYSKGLEFISNGDGTCYVSGIGDCKEKDIFIPTDSPDGDTVTGIGENAFRNCTNITSVTIPQSLECRDMSTSNPKPNIGNFAFFGCTGLKEVFFMDTIDQWNAIAKDVFWNYNTPDYVVHCSDGDVEKKENKQGVSLAIGGFAGDIFGNTTISNSSVTVKCEYDAKLGTNTVIADIFAAHKGNKTELQNTIVAVDKVNGLSKDYNKDFSKYHIENGNKCYDDVDILFASTKGTESGLKFDDGISENRHLNERVITGYDGKKTSIIIPQYYYEGGFICSIKAIDNGAFDKDCESIESLYIPSSIEFIGFGALKGCTKLIELTLPFIGASIDDEKNAYIGYVFGADSKKDNVTSLPKSMKNLTILSATQIADNAFENCQSLETISLPETVEEIGNGAFAYCTSLREFTIPDNVVKVGEDILEGCFAIKKITIGRNFEGVTNNARGGLMFGINKSTSLLEEYVVVEGNANFCSDDGILYRIVTLEDGYTYRISVVDAPAKANLIGFNLDKHIVEIEQYAFAYNMTLTKMKTNYVRMVGVHAFFNASNLKNIEFGEGEKIPDDYVAFINDNFDFNTEYYQYVGEYAFMGCDSLTDVNFNTSLLIGIGSHAFYDCPALNTVDLRKSIQEIGLLAFGECDSIEAFNVDDENKNYLSIDGILYRKNKNSDGNSDGSVSLVIFPQNYSKKDESGNYINVVYSLPEDVIVSSVDSYAFQGAKHLTEVKINPSDNTISIGDYAFANSSVSIIEIGKNVSSIGLLRDEGEYTVFSECNYLTEINVDKENKYYSSIYGVLFNKNQTKLIKYPSAKTDSDYVVPDTVSIIASMAFKHVPELLTVKINSYISTIGLEAFYDCEFLAVIFFDKVYAPTSVMENAFTTYHDNGMMIGYSEMYYDNGDDELSFGWINYDVTYLITPMSELPHITKQEGNGYYSVVVVDRNGQRIVNSDTTKIYVSLTDPNGLVETVEAFDGVATFYDLNGQVNLGFMVSYEQPYVLRVFDAYANYFAYVSREYYLDYSTRRSYVTLVDGVDVFGTRCDNVDINTQTMTLNKASYGKTYFDVNGVNDIPLIDPRLGYAEGNIDFGESYSERIEIEVIAYCDTTGPYKIIEKFIEESEDPIDLETLRDYKCSLYQNGVEIEGCIFINKDDLDSYTDNESWSLIFSVPVENLITETPIEVRVAITDGSTIYCPRSFLNINVIDFSVKEDDINLDAGDVSVDVAQGGNDIVTKLLGSKKWDFALGDHFTFSTAIDGDTVTLSLNGGDKKEEEIKKNSTVWSDIGKI